MTAPDSLRPILGRATQLGFVVRDIEAAMRHWTETFGVGPFLFLEQGPARPAATTWHRGEPVTVETRLAFGFIGDVEIELIEQVNGAPSPYREFLDRGLEGLQHLGFWVDDHAGACRRAEEAGYRRAYVIPAGGGDGIIYYEGPGVLGPMLEIIPPSYRRARQAVLDHLDGWRGSDASRFLTYGDFLAAAGVRFT